MCLKMYQVESKVGAIVCMLLALFFLGTWPAIMTLLERRGSLPQHTFFDCSITNILAALLIAFTFGEIGKTIFDNTNFIPQLYQVGIEYSLYSQGSILLCYHVEKG